jgi:6-phosphofructokinase
MVIVVAEGAGQELIAESSQLSQLDASGNRLLLDVGLWLSHNLKVSSAFSSFKCLRKWNSVCTHLSFCVFCSIIDVGSSCAGTLCYEQEGSYNFEIYWYIYIFELSYSFRDRKAVYCSFDFSLLSIRTDRSRVAMFRNHKRLLINVVNADPTYMVRAIPSNASDNVYCTLLAHSAMHGAMAGYTGFTVGPVNGRHVYIPIAVSLGMQALKIY